MKGGSSPHKKLYIFKIGGRLLDDVSQRDRFLDAFAEIPGSKILVHGGGIIADEMAAKLGIETSMHEGRRITDAATRDLVTMVYGGLLNKQVVARLQIQGCDALGLCGADAGLLRARKRRPEPIDYGFVGDIQTVRSSWLCDLLEKGFSPVIAPLSWDEKSGDILNSNADAVAAALTESLAAFYQTHLLYCFDKAGVMSDVHDPASLIAELNEAMYGELKSTHAIQAGMLPKLASCFAAKRNGAAAVLLASPSNGLAYARGQAFVGTLIQS